MEQQPKHISCNPDDIAKIVVMPGDPLRAKYIAKKYLKDAVLVSKVRNMFAYTGYYNGIRLTVMGHGMGMPSISIYAYELFRFFNVEKIIRIGTCGAFKENIGVPDLIVVRDVYTESNFALQYDGGTENLVSFDSELTNNILNVAKEKNIAVHYGTDITCDVFGPYVNMEAIIARIPKNIDILTEEMEAFALAYIGKKMNRKTAAILTAVDSKYTPKELTIEERETSLDSMILLALEAIIK